MSITYLKPNDEKFRRIIRPYEIVNFPIMERHFLGVSAYCYKRKENRTFKIDRILEMEIIKGGV